MNSFEKVQKALATVATEAASDYAAAVNQKGLSGDHMPSFSGSLDALRRMTALREVIHDPQSILRLAQLLGVVNDAVVEA